MTADNSFGFQLAALIPKLRRFARGLAASGADADDLVQSACERALRHGGQWQEGTRLDSWMYRIIQNLWLDSRRTERVRGTPVDVDETLNAMPSHDGNRAMEAQLTLGDVRTALDGMAEGQRVILLMVAVEGLSYRECADVLGIPVGTVMSRLARARLTLARRLENAGGEVLAP